MQPNTLEFPKILSPILRSDSSRHSAVVNKTEEKNETTTLSPPPRRDFGFGFHLFDDKRKSRFDKIHSASNWKFNAVCILPLDLCIAWNSDGVATILRKQIHWKKDSQHHIDLHYHRLLMPSGPRVTFKRNNLGEWEIWNKNIIKRASEDVQTSDLVFDVCLDKNPEFEKASRKMMDCLAKEGLVDGYEPKLPLWKAKTKVDIHDNKRVKLSNPQSDKHKACSWRWFIEI
ncbi:hypothetical protein J3R30DRAFT_3411120 [Lentinula aciculospora]|uniref:Uncharacterized protein n=1 Tax=Lentinula aciculospora TaxID=153920 RepID=A0A9W8ZVX7_9AGAR|nr:hypothetical protein J3R30DRAFT_3411120 [Lentinula aciculospora]